MWPEARIARLVDEYWQAVPEQAEVFPRHLAASASLALPVVIRELPHLSLSDVHKWLRSRGLADPVEGPERRLRGCLLAYGGYGFVLVDASDPEDEQRFTAAHELAHFMLDYLEPRRRAIDALGEAIVPVLDGERPPTHTERLQAILASVPIGLHVNLMERTAAGGYVASATAAAEDGADRLAFELLAPAAHAWGTISASLKRGETGHAALLKRSIQVLREQYGLPHAEASEYAKRLLKRGGRRRGAREWLGLDE